MDAGANVVTETATTGADVTFIGSIGTIGRRR